MLPLIGALVGAGASIYSANKAASAAKKAAKQQAAGIQRGIDESAGLYETGQNYLSPYVESGQRYAGLMDDIVGIGDPGNALETYRSSPSAALLEDVKGETMRRGMNTWAASGGANSGRAMEDLTRRMSDVTLQDYNNWRNFGQGIYGVGANAAGQASGLAMQRGRDILGARTGQGTATASGTAAGGLYNAAGMNAAGNYLANALGKTDFSQFFKTAPNVLPGGVGAHPY